MYTLSLSTYLVFLLANSLDPDQARRNVASDLEPYCLTLFINYSPSYIYMYILSLSTYLGFHLANSLDPDQARRNVASDLEPYCLTLFINYSLSYIYMYNLSLSTYLGFLSANSLDPDQARRNVAPDLEPYCLTLLITYSPLYIYMYTLSLSTYLELYCLAVLYTYLLVNIYMYINTICIVFLSLTVGIFSKIKVSPFALRVADAHRSISHSGWKMTRVFEPNELQCTDFHGFIQVCYSANSLDLDWGRQKVGPDRGPKCLMVCSLVNILNSYFCLASCTYIPLKLLSLHICTKISPHTIILTFMSAHLLASMLMCIYYFIRLFALRGAGALWSLSRSGCEEAEPCIPNCSKYCGPAQADEHLPKSVPERNIIVLLLLVHVCCCCCGCQYYYYYNFVKLGSFIQDIQWVFNTCHDNYIWITRLHVYTCNLATVELLGIPVYMLVYIYLKTLNRLLDTCMIIYCTGQSIFEFTSVLLRNEVPVLGVFAFHFTLYKLLINFSTCQLSPLLARQLSLNFGSYRELNSLQCIKGLASLIWSLKWI